MPLNKLTASLRYHYNTIITTTSQAAPFRASVLLPLQDRCLGVSFCIRRVPMFHLKASIQLTPSICRMPLKQ